MMIVLYCVTFFLICVSNAATEDWTGTTEIYHYENEVTCVVSIGATVWAATGRGIIKWNSPNDSYRVYTTDDGLTSNSATKLTAAPDSSIWAILNDRNIMRFDGTSWYSVADNSLPQGYRLEDLSIDSNGTAWILASQVIYRLDNRTWKRLTEDDGFPRTAASAIDIAPNGDIWFSYLSTSIDGPANGYGLARYSNGECIHYTEENGLSDNRVNDISFAPDGSVWVATYTGVSKFDGVSWTHYSVSDGLPEENIWVIHCSPDGSVFVSIPRALYRFNGTAWIYYSTDGNSIPGIYSFVDDKDGYVWGSTTTSISCYRDGNWIQELTEAEVGARCFYSLTATSDGAVWASSTYGLISFRNDEWAVHRVNSPAHSVVKAVKDSDGAVWCRTARGVAKYDSGAWTNYTMADGLPYNRICDIDIDSSGNIWASSDCGVSMFNGNSWTTYDTNNGLHHNWVQAVEAVSPDNVWISFERTGVAHFDGVSWTHFDDTDSLLINYVMDIESDDAGNVWFAANEGLSRYCNGQWKPFTQEDGFTGGWISQIVVGADGTAWCLAGTSCVLYRYDGSKWKVYETPSGSNLINAARVTFDSDNSSWVCWAGNILHITDNSMETYSIEDITGIADANAIYIDPENQSFIAIKPGSVIVFSGNKVFVEDSQSTPVQFTLGQNYPNPFNPSTTVSFSLDEDGPVTLAVYNLSGQRMTVLVDDIFSRGQYSVVWHPENIASGVYFIRLTAGSVTQTVKALFMK